jgi:hypothetical protein
MQKDLAMRLIFRYSLAMSNASHHQFGVVNGQAVLVLEISDGIAWVSFDDGREEEVSAWDIRFVG